MTPSLAALGDPMGIDLSRFSDPRGEHAAIRAAIAAVTPTRPTADWLSRVKPADIRCAEVMDWTALTACPVRGQPGMVKFFQAAGLAWTSFRGRRGSTGRRRALRDLNPRWGPILPGSHRN